MTSFYVNNTVLINGDIDLQSNKITTSTSNGNIVLLPNGTGHVSLSGMLFPTSMGSSGQFLSTNGSGTLSWATAPSGGGSSVFGGFKVKLDASGNVVDPSVDANWIYDAIGQASSWTFTRLGANSIRVTHNYSPGAGIPALPEVKSYGFDGTYYTPRTLGGAPTAAYSIRNENITQNSGAPQSTSFVMYGITISATTASANNHVFYMVTF